MIVMWGSQKQAARICYSFVRRKFDRRLIYIFGQSSRTWPMKWFSSFWWVCKSGHAFFSGVDACFLLSLLRLPFSFCNKRVKTLTRKLTRLFAFSLSSTLTPKALNVLFPHQPVSLVYIFFIYQSVTLSFFWQISEGCWLFSPFHVTNILARYFCLKP